MDIKDIINFNGSEIIHAKSNFKLNIKELDYLKKFKLNKVTDKGEEASLISNSTHIFNNLELERVKDYFHYQVKIYLREVMGIDHKLELLNSWYTLNKKNSQHHSHSHPNSFISICYYPQLKSGNIEFEKPISTIQDAFLFEYNIIKSTTMNTTHCNISLEEGDVVIFPSWLEHKSTPNLSSTPRIMVGANYFIRGKSGKDYNLNELNL